MMKNDNNQQRRLILYILALAVFMSFCINMANNTLFQSAFFGTIVVLFMLYLAFRKTINCDAVIWTMLLGAFVKASYILYTPVWERQHDVIDFGAVEGHAAYIEYILQNKALPNFDPRQVWAFFQPPLHHAVCAALMYVEIRLKIAERRLYENVQILPLCYMLVMTLIVYNICKELKLSSKATLITMLAVSFHPVYILMSGSINNDALALVLSAIAVYVALLWNKKPTLLKIILLGMCVGLSMMAKLSSVLIAPGIGVMMLYRVIKDVKDKKKGIIPYLLELLCFAIVVIPLGLWWPVRNYVKWRMPFNYIPEVGEQLVKTDLFSRIFDLRTSTVYPCLISNGDAYDEYNVVLAMFKTAFFGESNFSQLSPKITPFACIVFVFGIVIALLGISSAVYVCVNKEIGMQTGEKILFGGVLAGLLGGYFSFALSYSNFSAQDFRYSALAVSILAIFTGIVYDRMVLKGSKIRYLILASSVIFALGAFCTYMLVGLYQVQY